MPIHGHLFRHGEGLRFEHRYVHSESLERLVMWPRRMVSFGCRDVNGQRVADVGADVAVDIDVGIADAEPTLMMSISMQIKIQGNAESWLSCFFFMLDIADFLYCFSYPLPRPFHPPFPLLLAVRCLFCFFCLLVLPLLLVLLPRRQHSAVVLWNVFAFD